MQQLSACRSLAVAAKGSPKLWKDFVPVAFHVDYWDYLGWKDPFAAKAYAQRQHDYAAQWRSRSVYTPGFVLDGKEWRGGLNREDLLRASNKPAGVLSARSEDGRQWTLRFQLAAGNASSSYQFRAALLGFDLTSDVKAGENRGRRLKHDFAVLAMADVVASKDSNAFQGAMSLKSSLSVSPKRTALAVWVTAGESMEPVQALGGWLSTHAR